MEESTRVSKTLSIFAPGTPKTHFTSCCSSVLTTISAPLCCELCFFSVDIRHFPFCELALRRRGLSMCLGRGPLARTLPIPEEIDGSHSVCPRELGGSCHYIQ